MVISMRELGFKKFIVSDNNKDECAIIKDVDILPFKNLNDLVAFLNKEKEVKAYELDLSKINNEVAYDVDFSDIKGQESLKEPYR